MILLGRLLALYSTRSSSQKRGLLLTMTRVGWQSHHPLAGTARTTGNGMESSFGECIFFLAIYVPKADNEADQPL